ncbi:DMT family transporter [Plasticicumulans acidivorans]|uniref:O-acetylserine/cysteine efflux transporter n=1 Tax=Plasticicumulans acidivorans TaxID=886464 RepID=A0A317N4N2_9GAMM|nr:DMT family transporter [Plasticicumulans acidivorans]PWV65719.1 O-acetylserine/cysteine efflux transporter [Plasticicumulans acidivorans]
MPVAHVLLALVANAAWAFNFIAGKAGVAHFQPLTFTALRFSILLLLLLPWLRTAGASGRLFEVAGLMGIVHFGLTFGGLAVAADVSSVAIASQLYVPMSALLGVWLLGERLDARRIAGIAIAFGGVMLIGFDPVVFQRPLALLMIAVASLVLAWCSVRMRGMPNVGVFTMQAWTALAAVLGLWPLALLAEGDPRPALASADALQWAAPTYSAIGSSLVGHGIVYWLLQRHAVSRVTPLMLLAPVLAIIFGVLLWGDQPSWKLLLGGALTLAGVAVINVRGARRALAKENA